MKTSTAAKLAMPALVLAVAAIGCTPTGQTRPLAISASAAPHADAKSAALARQAETALRKGKPAAAITSAEAAVAITPRDADRRALLGQSYLAAGRFLSAEVACADAVALDPAHPRALLNLALAQIALGKWNEARRTLTSAQGKVPEADRGLGYALAGDTDAALAVLEPAARSDGATVKTRQNLALTYALAGRWAEAKVTAGQDLAPNLVDARMAEWALFARPQAVWEQVAMLLRVQPARDPGEPTALALAPEAAAPVQAAMAQPVPLAAPVEIAAAAPDAPAAVRASPVAIPEAPVQLADRFAPEAPVAVAAGPVYADAPSAPLLRADRVSFRRPMFVAPRRAAAAAAQREGGQWAVQLAAFSTAHPIDAAWTRVSGHSALVAGYAPSRSQHGGFQRLALAGFATRGAAAALCGRIRTAGGQCFVRATAGDIAFNTAAAPIRVASR